MVGEAGAALDWCSPLRQEVALSELTELYAEVVGCEKCPLAQGRTNAVPGEGPENAQILFIGEAPGFHENRLGRPFVGAAGQFLEELLASIHMRRDDVYICNVIKCRPPNNREPLPNEIEACAAFLDRQIKIIKPRLIVTLGRYSMAKFLPKASISRVHGVPVENRRIRGVAAFSPGSGFAPTQVPR